MSLKRNVLEHFKRDELLDAVDRFELEVGDRRVREGLVDALAGSRRTALAEILGDLSRDLSSLTLPTALISSYRRFCCRVSN